MTPPFTIADAAPGVAAIPLVCDSPHSGTSYPDDFGYAISHAALRRSEDTHVDRLWTGVAAVGGALLCATFPRSYIDANRHDDDIDVAMIGEPWPHEVRPSARTLELGIGLVWRETPERTAIYDRKLTAAQVARRIERYWRPYREAVASQLERTASAHGGYWHLNLHSMPSNAYERLGLPKTRPLADVVLGDRHGTTCEPAFVDIVASAFRLAGYTVAINDPYEGAELVRVAGDPARNRHSLQIEMNRALYMDELTREPHGGFNQLQTAIGQVLAEVAAYVGWRVDDPPQKHKPVTSAP